MEDSDSEFSENSFQLTTCLSLEEEEEIEKLKLRIFTQPISQPISQPILQPISQPILQPISQRISQPILQPILQPISQRISDHEKFMKFIKGIFMIHYLYF